jgi:signal transduction histidine kinase
VGMSALLIFREARTRNLRKIDALELADQARKNLLSVVSHDLKNPLSSLLMTNEILLKTLPIDCDFTEKRKRLLLRSHHAAEKMRRLITDLLDSAKIEAGKLEIHPIRCVAKQILDQTLELFEPIAAEKSVQLVQLLPDELPALWADPERLSQIFSNIIGNAIKFSESGGQISIRAIGEGSEVRFSITDSGAGIPADELPHLFARYWQAKKTQSLGTGLGLTICKELVAAHGGRIWAESEIGKGTTIFFTLAVLEKTHVSGFQTQKRVASPSKVNSLDM